MLAILNNKFQVLDKGFVILLDIMGNDKSIVDAARVSYLTRSKGDDIDKKLLFYLMQNNHTSPFEMVEFKFHIKCPIFVARQWMRHRTWSYNEMSRRYTSRDIEFYVPDNWRYQSKANKQVGEKVVRWWLNKGLVSDLERFNDIGLNMYHKALANGVAREQARMFLGVNLYTEFIAKVDAHNLMHFLSLRMDKKAQYETRVYADVIFKEILTPLMPWTSESFELYKLDVKKPLILRVFNTVKQYLSRFLIKNGLCRN